MVSEAQSVTLKRIQRADTPSVEICSQGRFQMVRDMLRSIQPDGSVKTLDVDLVGQ